MQTLQEPKNVEINGSFKTAPMSIMATSEAFETLSKDMYTYLERAVVREYSCNAWDAHIDAGVDKPFEVHLPTPLEPWFAVRDFGYGLDEADMINVFGGYFNSSKRNTNNQVGFFGLGSKSAFALAESFTVTSYHGGLKVIYSFYKDQEDHPQVAVLDTSPSDETGLEVKVTVHDKAWEFKREAVNVFKYWENLPKINDQSVVEEIEEWRSDFDLVRDDYSFKRKVGNTKAVMGNVAYDIPYEYDILKLEGYVTFEIGELKMTPSREQLSVNELTRGNLESKLSMIKEELGAQIKAEIEEEDNDFMKAVKHDQLNRGVFSGIMQLAANRELFQGYRLPDTTEAMKLYQRNYNGAVKMTETLKLPLDQTDYYIDKPLMTGRIRLEIQSNRHLSIILLTEEQVAFYEIPADMVKDLEDLEKPERYSNGSGRTVCKVRTFELKQNTSYSHKKEAWKESEVDILSEEEKVYVEISWFLPASGRYRFQQNKVIIHDVNRAKSLGVEMPIVYGIKKSLTKTKKFQNGNFIELGEYLERELAKVAPDKAYEFNQSCKDQYTRLCKQGVLTELWEVLEKCTGNHSDFLKKFGITLEVDKTADDLVIAAEKKYPLLEAVIHRQPSEDIAEYVRAIDLQETL